MQRRDIVVIGTSAGGIATLRRLLPTLPSDLAASVLIVQHMAPHSPGLLPRILGATATLPVVPANDGAPITPGVIHVAVPDRHLLLDGERMRLVRTPRENRHRPGIDTLFRSAAASQGPRVIGVVLTGTLDDGSAGLWEVKRAGGIAVVQDPDDALYPEMPLSALRTVEADYTVAVDEMGSLLAHLTREPLADWTPPRHPRPVTLENERAMNATMGSDDPIAVFTCPDCQGTLRETLAGRATQYRCHIGHAYSPASLAAAQEGHTEHALEMALRALEEKAMLSRRVAELMTQRAGSSSTRHLARAREADQAANVLRGLLTTWNESDSAREVGERAEQRDAVTTATPEPRNPPTP